MLQLQGANFILRGASSNAIGTRHRLNAPVACLDQLFFGDLTDFGVCCPGFETVLRSFVRIATISVDCRTGEDG